VWSTVWTLDAELTSRHARREDPSSGLSDVVLLGAAIASLIAVGVVLAGAGHASGVLEYLQAGLALMSVFVSWTLIHTVFTRRASLVHSGRPAPLRARFSRSSLAGIVAGGLLCLRARISRYGQPDASAGLPYHLLCTGSIGIAGSLVTYRNSGQVGALLYIERQSLRSLRILRRRDSCTPHRSVVSRVSARSVRLGHGCQPFPVDRSTTRWQQGQAPPARIPGSTGGFAAAARFDIGRS